MKEVNKVGRLLCYIPMRELYLQLLDHQFHSCEDPVL
jgi:hypothetical protein